MQTNNPKTYPLAGPKCRTMLSNASFGQGPCRTAQPPPCNKHTIPTVAAQNNTSVAMNDDDDSYPDLGDDIICELLETENEFLCSQAARQQERLQRESLRTALLPRDIAPHAPRARGGENGWVTDQRWKRNEKIEGAGSAHGKANDMKLQLHSSAVQAYHPAGQSTTGGLSFIKKKKIGNAYALPSGQPTHDSSKSNIIKNEQENKVSIQKHTNIHFLKCSILPISHTDVFPLSSSNYKARFSACKS